MMDTHQQDNITQFETLEQSLSDLRGENLRLQSLMNSKTTEILEVVDTWIGEAFAQQHSKMASTLDRYFQKQEEIKAEETRQPRQERREEKQQREYEKHYQKVQADLHQTNLM